MSDAPAYSLWLLPEADALEHLSNIVARLAPRFATRAFLPHATIQGDLTRRLHDLAAVAGQLASSTPVQTWRVRGIELSDAYYRAFFVAFDDCPEFAPLCARSAQALGDSAGLSPFAHLSLAYGTLDVAAKVRLIEEFAAELPASLPFDRIGVALSGKSVGIASWRTLQTFALAPPARRSSGELPT